MNQWKQSNKSIYVAAHRGWRDKYPENTIEAFQAALDIGVDQIETDVRITKDGERKTARIHPRNLWQPI